MKGNHFLMFYLMFWRSWKHILAFSQFLIKILEIPKFGGTPFNFWWRQQHSAMSAYFFLCQWLYFGLLYISGKFYWQQTSITRDIERRGDWISASPPGTEEPLKSPVHIWLTFRLFNKDTCFVILVSLIDIILKFG